CSTPAWCYRSLSPSVVGSRSGERFAVGRVTDTLAEIEESQHVTGRHANCDFALAARRSRRTARDQGVLRTDQWRVFRDLGDRSHQTASNHRLLLHLPWVSATSALHAPQSAPGPARLAA